MFGKSEGFQPTQKVEVLDAYSRKIREKIDLIRASYAEGRMANGESISATVPESDVEDTIKILTTLEKFGVKAISVDSWTDINNNWTDYAVTEKPNFRNGKEYVKRIFVQPRDYLIEMGIGGDIPSLDTDRQAREAIKNPDILPKTVFPTRPTRRIPPTQ